MRKGIRGMWVKDGGRIAEEEKKRKTEAEVDGQNQG